MLYKLIELPSDEPVQFVGVYVLNWNHKTEPDVAFVRATQQDIEEAHGQIYDYEDETADDQ